MTELNELAVRLRDALLVNHPDWAEYVGVLDGGDLEVAVPAPVGSRAGHLVIFTARGQDIWLRFAPPFMCYSVESTEEMESVLHALLSDDAFFVAVTNGDSWVETGLYRPGQEPVLQEGHVANAVSWTGHHDKVVTSTRP
jgi:hypothetical protein